ncbi:MAG: hypothetical protein ACLQVL_26890 [Terriglobia bacterium]
MDDVTAAKFFQILRAQQISISDLSLQVQTLIDCLSLLPDFEVSFEKRKAELSPLLQKGFQPVLDSIEEKIRELKKSNGGT